MLTSTTGDVEFAADVIAFYVIDDTSFTFPRRTWHSTTIRYNLVTNSPPEYQIVTMSDIHVIDSMRQEIVKCNLLIKALIQVLHYFNI
jgi:hypothetical protein